MKNRVIEIPAVKAPIMPCPGFQKKSLADYKLDIMGLCGFGCRYCSSNTGNYLRINRERFAEATEAQLGSRIYSMEAPDLTFHWLDVLDRLEHQLIGKSKDWGAGKTLVFSMLTDGFSPLLVKHGVTEAALRMVLQSTSFRIRVLTKNAVVGNPKWVDFFAGYPGRFVVGLSTGTLDDDWAQRIDNRDLGAHGPNPGAPCAAGCRGTHIRYAVPGVP
jgi:DNA repair photolyase